MLIMAFNLLCCLRAQVKPLHVKGMGKLQTVFAFGSMFVSDGLSELIAIWVGNCGGSLSIFDTCCLVKRRETL